MMGRKGGLCGGKRRDWKRKWQEERNVVFLPNAGDGGSEEREAREQEEVGGRGSWGRSRR